MEQEFKDMNSGVNILLRTTVEEASTASGSLIFPYLTFLWNNNYAIEVNWDGQVMMKWLYYIQ